MKDGRGKRNTKIFFPRNTVLLGTRDLRLWQYKDVKRWMRQDSRPWSQSVDLISSFFKLMWLGAIFSKKIGLSGLLIFYRKVSRYCTYSPLRSMLFNWRHLANLVSHTFSNRGLMIINLVNDIFITRMWKLYCLISVSSAPVLSLRARTLESTSSPSCCSAQTSRACRSSIPQPFCLSPLWQETLMSERDFKVKINYR